jgi:hypothetical protein
MVSETSATPDDRYGYIRQETDSRSVLRGAHWGAAHPTRQGGANEEAGSGGATDAE